jgi:hypothetical protein
MALEVTLENLAEIVKKEIRVNLTVASSDEDEKVQTYYSAKARAYMEIENFLKTGIEPGYGI